ncbi:hypothetical protein ARAM_001401 [Aspergillus rambellii]|uniref:Protein kinase domain-containing protein n=1 Tax=Aspergillus rambellii TaxID=308745 RepID=A0A0F8WNC1_9EURO|nr:hypothetical protein ARAM_001401 [Aspergillus rambellii]
MSSSSSEFTSDQSDHEIAMKQSDSKRPARPPMAARASTFHAGESRDDHSDIKDLLDADAESHSNMMTAALLEFYCLTRAAELLNRQHGSHKRYTRDSPEVQFLGKKMYSYKSQFLSSHGVIAEDIDRDELRSTRQYYRDNLDALGLSALEDLNLDDRHGPHPSIGAAGNLVLPSNSSKTVDLRSNTDTAVNLPFGTKVAGPLDLRRRPVGGRDVRTFEDFQLDPRRLPRLIPLTGSSPVSFPLFELNPPPPDNRMSRYAVEFSEIKILGRGSFGEVYHVKNHIDGQDYAVKKIPLSQKRLEQLQGGNQNQLENIMKEIRTLARLEHAHVVRYYGAWVEQTHFPRFPLINSKPPAKLEYEQTREESLELTRDDDSFGIVFEHSEGAEHQTSTEDESIDSHSDHDATIASHSSKKTLSASLEEDVESIPRNFNDPSASQLSTFGASDDDIFTDGFSYDQSRLQIQRRTPAGAAVPAVILHIQMSLHPVSLSSYLNPQQKECVDGSQSLIRRHCYHLVPSLRLMLKIITGVNYLHSKGIVHRDLKPANIFLSCIEDGSFEECLVCKADNGVCSKFCHPRIGDFGLVADISHLNDDHSPESPMMSNTSPQKPNRIVGTEFYCPPAGHNKIIGLPEGLGACEEELMPYSIDEKLDVYALGVILFELLYRLNTKMERQMVLTGLTRGLQRQTPFGLSRERPVFPVDFAQKVDQVYAQCAMQSPLRNH